MLVNTKEERGPDMIIMGYFNTQGSSIDHPYKESQPKKSSELNCTID
jgi:hypothetical protein